MLNKTHAFGGIYFWNPGVLLAAIAKYFPILFPWAWPCDMASEILADVCCEAGCEKHCVPGACLFLYLCHCHGKEARALDDGTFFSKML